jgi:hypothetical protein
MRTVIFGSRLEQLGIVCSLMLAPQFGCGEAPSDNSAPAAAAHASPAVPYPSDPDTLITFSVADVDQDGSIKVTSHGQITKGAQWERLFGKGDLAGTATSNVSNGALEKASSPIVIETCWHGSPIVMNDQAGFAGNYLCFNNSLPTKFVGLDGSFVVRSIYAVAPVLMSDINSVRRFLDCGSNLVVADPYTGPNIRYLATVSNRAGVCHF